MISDLPLDAVIRQARHLLFAFDGPIRSVNKAGPADSTPLTAPITAYLCETLAACFESGRSVGVISASPSTEVRTYLDAHDLLTQVTVVAVSIGEAVGTLEAPPANCLLITSSPTDIEAAQSAGTPSMGYAKTPAAAHLGDAGAIAFVYSLADVALRLRATTFDRE
jgi:beta-phosphoglucomutase-like phosphatase (HAD superfamily)